MRGVVVSIDPEGSAEDAYFWCPVCDQKYIFKDVLPEEIETREELVRLIKEKNEELSQQHYSCGEYSLD